MATSGRDRDPAFRRKKVTPKPAKKPSTEGKTEETPETTPPVKPVEKAAATNAPTPAKPAPSSPAEDKDSLTSPVVEPQKKVLPPLDYEEDSPAQKTSTVVAPTEPKEVKKEKPKSEKPKVVSGSDNNDSSKTSKKSKLLGVIVAFIFVIGISFIGYYLVTNIMQSENESGQEITNQTESDESDSEGSPHEGNVTLNEEGGEETGKNEEEMRETTLTDENSLESEIASQKTREGESQESTERNESTNEGTTNSENVTQEKQALSKIIRKKGDFEVPCWIIAFSANNKKPLANMNYSALEALGFDAGIYWIPKYFPSGKSLYKVYVGPYKSPEQAQAILPQIRNLQPDAYVMKIEE